MTTKFSHKQQRFIDEYLVDLNATQAAIRAGYSPKRADQIGHENLGKPDISAAIAEARNKITDRLGVTRERVLQELARIAFFDIKDIFDEQGRLLPTSEIPEDARRALGGLTLEELVRQGQEGAGDLMLPGTLKKVRIVDKLRALEMLMKYLGMFEKDNQQKEQPTMVILNLGGAPSDQQQLEA